MLRERADRAPDPRSGQLHAGLAKIPPFIGSGTLVCARMKSSISVLPGPVSKATGSPPSTKDGGNTADIEHGDRVRAIKRVRQRLVVERVPAGALPAGRHAGRTEVVDQGMPSRRASASPSPICTVSRLSGLCRTVWPWKADDVDGGIVDAPG